MILILGGSGYIGSAFVEYFTKNNIKYKSISRKDYDYYCVETLRDVIQRYSPSFLINCAGYTGKPNVDACEIYKDDCITGNVVLPGRVKTACFAEKLKFGHVSSGCIYTGKKIDGSGFTELDKPNFCFETYNCSYYSGCKALGEAIVTSDLSYVWRIRIPFNNKINERNYLCKLLNYRTLLDVENSITNLDEFVDCAYQSFAKSIPCGIYNVTNPGSMTTRDICNLINNYVCPKKKFEFFKNEEEFMRLAAKTPRSSCVLDSSKLAATGIHMKPIEASITDALKSWSGSKACVP